MNDKLAQRWKTVTELLHEKFGKESNLEAILFLIGIQELGKVKNKFTKEQKEDLMHIAMCTILSPSGYYELEGYDEEGWPHFKELKHPPGMKIDDQEDFLKEHIIHYFENRGIIHFDPSASDQ